MMAAENVTAFYESGSRWLPLLVWESVTVAKLISMLILGLGSFVMGTLPLKIMFGKCQSDTYWLEMGETPPSAHHAHSHGAEPRFASSCLSFSGGVLLFTAIVHVLPEVRESVEHMQEDGVLPAGPALPHLGDLIFCAGFFMVYLLEEIVQFALTRYVVPSRSSVRSVFAVFALSLHEVFEGTAIGLQATADDVWYLSVAVAAHKLIIAFCLGLELVTAGAGRLWLVLSVATFAAVTPVGISAGMLFVLDGPFTVIIQGLFTGTLLYVVFFEVFARSKSSGFLSFAFAMFGFLVMYTVHIFFSEYTRARATHAYYTKSTRCLLLR